MTALDQEQDVVDLAQRLGLGGAPVASIVKYCQSRVADWIAQDNGVTDIDQLQQLVMRRLNLVFEEIHENEDLDEVKYRYAERGEYVFATLQADLSPDTFGTLIRLRDESYVAVIDCRGDKASRRFFTRWHELAHLLVEPDTRRQVFRETNDPLERLMDQIAGEIGFYAPLFGPIFEQHTGSVARLSFEVIDGVRQAYCADASFQSTLFACMRHSSSSLLYLEAALAYSASESRQLQNPNSKTDTEARPQPQLRVKLAIPNQAALRSNLVARRNMRVPDSSVIYQAYRSQQELLVGEENLKSWIFSSGGSLDDCDVTVEASWLGERVIGTIQPAN